MIDPYSFTLGATLGNGALAIGYILTRWRKRQLQQRRDARALIESARAGTDLEDFSHQEAPGATNSTLPGIGTPPIHWSDICRSCHHERHFHNDGTGSCEQRNPHSRLFCPCTAFEVSR